MTVIANSNNVPPIANKPAFKLFAETPPLPIFIDALFINSVATAKATNMPANAVTTYTASHNLSGSINVNAIIAPANIAIDMAISLRAAAFNRVDMLFDSFATAIPILVNMSPSPDNGLVITLSAFPIVVKPSENFLMDIIVPIPIAAANIFCKSISLNMSLSLENMFPKKSMIVSRPFFPLFLTFPKSIFFIKFIILLPINFKSFHRPDTAYTIPLIRPSIIFLPISKNSVDGE